MTPDQKRVLELAGNDQALRKALMELFAVIEKNPTYHWMPWPFATRDRCHAWAAGAHSDILDEMREHKTMKGIWISRWNPKYIGWIPTFEDHAVLIVTLSNGKKFYLDNALAGGTDDHIFFDVPDSLVDERSKEYAQWLKNRQDLVDNYCHGLGTH